MRVGNRYKIRILNLLIVLLLISSMPVYSASARFKDVPKGEWYYEYVEEMAKIGYLQGKGDGRFDPEGNLTFMETMAAFSRLTRPTAVEKSNAMTQYAGLMNELGVKQNWEREALSLALYKDIVNVNEVRNIYTAKLANKALQKVNASVFLARAMGLEERAKDLPVVFLEYNDVSEIKSEYRKYLKVLQDTNVLDEKGDGSNFNPKEPLRRKIMATMLSRAHTYLINNPIDSGDKEEPIIDNTISVKGVVNRITNEIGRQFLVIENTRGDEESYVLDPNTIIKLDGSNASISHLKKGQEVRLEINERTRELISVVSTSVEEKVEGVVVFISTINDEIRIDENINGDVKRNIYELSKSVSVNIDGKSSRISNLRNGDFVKLKLSNNVVREIDGQSEEIKVRGDIIKIEKLKDGRNNDHIITIETKDDKYEVLVDSKTRVDRDRKSARPEDLKKKDDVYVVARYSIDKNMYLAEDVDAKVVTEKVTGFVIEITSRLNENPMVKIKNLDNNKEETYELVSGAYIRVDGKTVSTLPYNPGYKVDLYVEGGSDIVEAYADSTSMESSIMGKIDYIDSRNDYIEVEVQSIVTGNTDKKYIRVYIEDDTVITNKYLENLKFKDLYRNDNVSIIGIYKGANFVADTIQVR